MKNRVNDTVGKIHAAQRKRHRTTALLLALSCFVFGDVFWQLRSVGTAMTGDRAGVEPDQISGSEITADFVGPSPPGAVSVMQNELVPLSDMAVSDPEADIETAADWEDLLPDVSAETPREAVAAVAHSQLGYTESASNFVRDDESNTRRGYTRYGAWFGTPYCDWNTAFTCFCLHYAGIPEYEIPCGAECTGWYNRLKDAGTLLEMSEGTPQSGDLIFMDTDADALANRSAIVVSVETDDEDITRLTAIEGDCDNAVAEQVYILTDPQIIGFVPMPEEFAEDAEPEVTFRAESESGVSVYASAREGVFPEDAEMTVSDVEAEELLNAIDTEEPVLSAVAVDITFRDADGEEIEPEDGSAVQIRISLPEEQQLPEGEFAVHHQLADGTVEQIEDADITSDSACFTATSFSIYIVTQFEDKEEDHSKEFLSGYYLTDNGDGHVANDYNHLYIMRKGDTVKIYSDQ